MADDLPDPPPYDPASGAPHPALAQFVGSMETPDGQDWAIDTAQRLQQHITGQALAQQADDAGNEIVHNLAAFKDGAVNFVRRDPTALDAVLDIVPRTVGAVSQVHPETDMRDTASSDLTKHIQAEAVKAGIQTLAENHRDIASVALAKYKDYLDPSDHAALGQYVDNMAAMRQADYEGERRDQLRRLANNSDREAISHLAELAHPDTGQLSFPPQWGQRMMANPAILPSTKGALLRAYAGLQVNGDPPAADPDVVTRLIQQAAAPGPGPSAADVISQVGQKLGASDGAWLASRMGPQTAAVRDETQALANTLTAAQAQIGNRQAYGRFVNWFLPSYQRATAQGAPWANYLSPEGEGYVLAPERMQQFMPNGNDAVAAIPRTGPRPPLGQLFAASWGRDDRSLSDQLAGPRKPHQGEPIERPLFPRSPKGLTLPQPKETENG